MAVNIENEDGELHWEASVGTSGLESDINRMKVQMASYQAIADKATDPQVINEYVRKIQSLNAEILKLTNAGTMGFTNMGAAMGTTVGFAGALLQVLKAAGPYILEAIVAAAAGYGVQKWLDDLFANKTTAPKTNQDLLNEVHADANKNAGKQLSDLKILYKVATDLTNSTEDRTAATKKLQAQYPEYFANSSAVAIMNGKEKQSFDKLTDSISKNAKARAVAEKLAVFDAERANIAYKQEKIRNANKNEVKRLRQVKKALEAEPEQESPFSDLFFYPYLKSILDPLGSVRDRNIAIINDEISQSNVRATEALVVEGNKKKKLEESQNVLTKYAAGYNDIAKTLFNGGKKITDSAKYASQRINIYVDNQEADIERLLNVQLSLNEKLRDFRNKQNAKQLSPDEAAVVEVTSQFELIKAAIVKANIQYDRFVKKYGADAVKDFNAKKANKVKLVRIDPATLDKEQGLAETNQRNLNENKHVQKEIEVKKQLYADYEAYRLKAGDEIADAEYANLLTSGKSFEVYLRSLQDGIDSKDKSAAIVARLNFVKNELSTNAQDQRRVYQELLAETISFETKRAVVAQVYLEKVNRLRAENQIEAANLVAIQGEAELASINLQAREKLAAYQQLSNQIRSLAYADAAFRLEQAEIDAKRAFGAREISKQTYEEMIAYIQRAREELRGNEWFNNLNKVGDIFAGLSQSVAGFNNGLASAFRTISDIAKGAKSAADNFKDARSAIQNYDTNKANAGGGLLGSVSAGLSVAAL